MDQPRRTLRSALFLSAVALTVAACGPRYPLGMSEAEWNRLTPQQQLQARAKQADINRASAERRARARDIRRRREAMLAAAERRRIERIYASGRYGDILECVMDEGQADFHPGWHRFSPVPFALVRGEGKYVKLRGGQRTGKFWAEYSDDGLEVTICYRKPRSRRSSRDCATVAGLTSDYANGIVRHVSATNIFQRARVLCTFRPGREPRPELRGIVIRQENITIRNIIHGRHHRGHSYPSPYRDYTPPGHRGPPPGYHRRSQRDDDDRHGDRRSSRRDSRDYQAKPVRTRRGPRTSEDIREAARRAKEEREELRKRGKRRGRENGHGRENRNR